MTQILVTVGDPAIARASELPAVAALAATPIPRGVIFTWNLDLWIQPNKWRFRVLVGTGTYSGWASTLFPIQIRTLTTEELDRDGADVRITIQVKSFDGVSNYGAMSETYADCLVLTVGTSDVAAGSIALSHLSSAVTDRMFESSARSGADLADVSIGLDKLAGEVTDLMFDTAEHAVAIPLSMLATAVTNRMFVSDARKADDTDHVHGMEASDVENGALHGEEAHAKLASDVGTDTIASTVVVTETVDARVSSSEKTKLESLIGVALADIDTTGGAGNVDRVLVIEGANTNLTTKATVVKTGLALLDAVLETNVIAKINASSEATKIASASIVELAGTKLKVTTPGGTAIFDSSGNLKIGVTDGGSTPVTRTAAQIVGIIDAGGHAANLNLLVASAPYVGIAHGTLNDVPQTGTNKSVTANEKTGAARAYTGLNSSGQLITGTANSTVAELDNAVDASQTPNQPTIDATTYTEFTEAGGVSAYVVKKVTKLRRDSSSSYVLVRFFGKRTGGALNGYVRVRAVEEIQVGAAWIDLTPSACSEVSGAIVSAGYVMHELELEFPVAGWPVGDYKSILFEMMTQAGTTIVVENSVTFELKTTTLPPP